MYCNILPFYTAIHRCVDLSFEKFDTVILTLHLHMNRWSNFQVSGAPNQNFFDTNYSEKLTSFRAGMF